MGVQKILLQKTNESSAGTDSLNVEFYGSNRQFYWLELSLVYDKSDKHLTIYDSCNVEKAAKLMKSLALDNNTQKRLLFKQFVAWSCDGCSVAPLTDYTNNPIYQELPSETGYFNSSDEEI